MDWLKLALWLEVIGFGLSVLMVGVIKIENIKRIANELKEITQGIGLLILAYLLVPYIMGLFLVDEKWWFKGRWDKAKLDELFPRRPARQRLINALKGIGILIVVFPVTHIVLYIIELPEYLINKLALLLKTRETATFWFLFIGSVMILAGLIIELANV